MGTAGFSHVGAFDAAGGSASTTVSAALMPLTVAAAGMALLMVMVTVRTGGHQFPLQIGCHRLIRISLGPGTKLYPGVFQSILGAASDARRRSAHPHLPLPARRPGLHALPRLESITRLETYPALLHLIHFEKLCFSEMLEKSFRYPYHKLPQFS